MPPSGWYDDPDQPWTWRYFDGAHWTDHRAPKWVPPAVDPRSFSVWFESATDAVKLATRRVGALLVGVWLLLGAMGAWLAIASFDDERGRELRRLLGIEQGTVGPMGSTTTELTDAEADRAWELLQDVFRAALPWVIALAVAFVVVAAWSVAVVARAIAPQAGGRSAGRPVQSVGSTVVQGLRRTPAVVGSGAVVLAAFVGTWVLASVPVLAVIGAGGGGPSILLTVVFVVLLVMAATVWLWGRLTLASAIAGSGGGGLGVVRSWHLTHGRFWFVAGRLLITGLVAGALSALVNFVNIVGQFLGFATYIALAALVQALVAAAATVITVCGHVATIDQLDEPDAPH